MMMKSKSFYMTLKHIFFAFFARVQSLFASISSGQYSMEGEIWDCVSDGAKDLLRKMLQVLCVHYACLKSHIACS